MASCVCVGGLRLRYGCNDDVGCVVIALQFWVISVFWAWAVVAGGYGNVL